ncbi:MAG: hypothetical protein IJA05_03880 [Oscillospiraceae bacterium]|nr:hypothetical protein [Oscillospiraceae bacterium]
MKSVERKPRRIAVAILSVIVIAIMWQNKDVLGLWNGISAEDILPLLVTNSGVIAIRIAVFAGIVWIIRRAAAKIRSKKA